MAFLEIKHLRMVRTLADIGNMTRAAKILALSQSALSQQLKDIEDKLGVALFYRTRKRMLLTSAGERLLQAAESIVDRLDATERDIVAMANGESGALKVGTQCIFCFRWLPRLMEDFQQRFVGIDFEIGISHEPAADLLQRKYDVVVTALAPGNNNFDHVPLFCDELICIMGCDHPLSSRPHMRLADFHGQKLISHVTREESSFYQRILRPRGIEPGRFMAVGQPQAIIELAGAGLGIGIFPRWAIKSTLATAGTALTALPITTKGFPLTWSAVFLRTNNMSTHQRAFIDMIRDMGTDSLGEYGRPQETTVVPFPRSVPD